MPFALPELGFLAYAVLMLIIAASIGTLLGFLDRFTPNLRILGWDGFGWVHRGIGDIQAWQVGVEDAAILRIRNVLVDIGHITKSLFSGHLSVAYQLYNLIRHVNNASVPNAQNSANQYTNSQVSQAEAALAAQLDRTHADLAAGISSVSHGLAVLGHTTVPAEIATSRSAIETELRNADAGINTTIGSLSSAMTTDLANVWDAIGPLQTAVSSTLPASIAALAAREQADIVAARATAVHDLQNAQSRLQSDLNTVNDSLSTQITTAQQAAAALSAADLTTAEGQATAIAAQDAIATATAAQSALNTKAASLQASITSNERSITTLQATTAITLPALPNVTIPSDITVPVAVGALAASVAGVITEIDRCMVSTCDGPNNYQNLLNMVTGGIDFAAMIAFLASAANDPEGEAKAFSSVATGLYTTGHALVDGLLAL